MTEFGLFNDEGLVEGQFYSESAARDALDRYDPEDELEVREICPDHEEQPRYGCEECDAEE